VKFFLLPHIRATHTVLLPSLSPITWATIPIILCTGDSDTVSPETAKDVGIREFLMKPLAKKELAEAVRRVLDGKIEE